MASKQRVIDIGCGKAELLVRLVDQYGCFGTGIDINEEFLREATMRVQTSLHPTRIELPGMNSDRASRSVGKNFIFY